MSIFKTRIPNYCPVCGAKIRKDRRDITSSNPDTGEPLKIRVQYQCPRNQWNSLHYYKHAIENATEENINLGWYLAGTTETKEWNKRNL